MRLIDADEAIINFGFEWDDVPPTIEEFVRFLKKQPTVDAVEVVRCKECEYFLQYSEKYKQEVECADGDCFIKCLHSEEVQYCPRKNDDYCSFGERRDSND